MAADNERIAAWMRWYVHGIIQWRFAVILLLGAISIYLASHIGQLKVEVDWLRKKGLSRWSNSGR